MQLPLVIHSHLKLFERKFCPIARTECKLSPLLDVFVKLMVSIVFLMKCTISLFI